MNSESHKISQLLTLLLKHPKTKRPNNIIIIIIITIRLRNGQQFIFGLSRVHSGHTLITNQIPLHKNNEFLRCYDLSAVQMLKKPPMRKSQR